MAPRVSLVRRVVLLFVVAGAGVVAWPLLRHRQQVVPIQATVLDSALSTNLARNEGTRHRRSVRMKADLVLGAGEPHLGRPESVQIDKDGNLWVFDWGRLSVKEFSPQGALLREYGGKLGRGPGELVSPTDFAITDDGQVWILDAGQKRVNIYDSLGAPLRHIVVTRPTLRFLLFPSKEILFVTLADSLFMVTDSLGRQLRSFGHLVQNQFVRKEFIHAIAASGEVARSGPNEFVFAPLRAGYIGRFRLDGGMVYYRQAIEPVPFPSVEKTSTGRYRVGPNSPVAAYDVAANADRVYVLARATSAHDTTRVIDVYALRDGQYLYSLAVPGEPVRALQLRGPYLYTVSDSTVTRWALNTPN